MEVYDIIMKIFWSQTDEFRLAPTIGGKKIMQPKKQQHGIFIIRGGIALTVFLLIIIAIIWLEEVSKTDQTISILQKIGIESPEALHKFLILAAAVAVLMFLVFLILFHRYRYNESAILDQEKADNVRLTAALAQIKRERTAMENIQAALGSGPWSMDFNEQGELISCIWTDVFRKMLGYESEADFPNKLDSWSNLLHEEDKAYVMKEYWDTVKDYTGQKTYDVEYAFSPKMQGGDGFMLPAGSPEGRTVPRSPS